MRIDEVETQARHVYAVLQDFPLWPPEQAVATLGELVRTAGQIATEPPPPDPGAVDAAQRGWFDAGQSADAAAGRSADVGYKVTPQLWGGRTGDALRSSASAHATRVGSLQTAATDLASTLGTFADEVRVARKRHDVGAAALATSIQIRPSWNPLDVIADVVSSVGRVGDAVGDMVGAYQDVARASDTAASRIRPAVDTVQLPDRVPTGMTAVDTVDGYAGRDKGPLRGTVLDRASAALDAMSPADRARVQQLLAAAPDPQHKAWILAAVAGGADPNTLANFAQRIDAMSTTQLATLDPTSRASEVRDPLSPFLEPSGNAISCGPDSLVMARMINDPVFALQIMTGYDATTGTGPAGASTDAEIAQRFNAASDAMHDGTNQPIDHTGAPQVPWPEQFGTTPAAAANAMSGPGGVGVPGTDYGFQATDPDDPGVQYNRIAGAVSGGHAVPLYLGTAQAPRHIVLVTGEDETGLEIYDPDLGVIDHLTRDQFLRGAYGTGTLARQPWGAVLPTG